MNLKQEGWYFPSGKDLQKESGSNALIEMFNDHPLTSLAREICQNSLDAKREGLDKPVRVEFKVFDVLTKDIPGYEQLKSDILIRAQKEWNHDYKTKKMIEQMQELLDKKKIKVMKISDFNTTGLRQENWESLIEQVGSSVKKDNNSAGSFGIGKGAPFAVSKLRTVVYSTLADEGLKTMGVMKFVSIPGDKTGYTTQGTGYFGKNSTKVAREGKIEFDPEITRSEKGTDIYIVGFNEDLAENWEKEITYSLVDNFLFSFFKKKLEVVVGSNKGHILIDYKAAKKIINENRNDKKFNRKYPTIVGYLDVLEDPNRKELKLTAFEKAYMLEPGEVHLYVSDKGVGNRRVLMTRNAGMKIKDQKNISSYLDFSGIFYAEGPLINKRLKVLENPNHDDWSKDRSSSPRDAEKFLKFMTSSIRDAIISEFKNNSEEEVSAYGVSDFLPEDLDSIRNNKKDSKENIFGDTSKFEIKLPKVKSNKVAVRKRNSGNGDLETDELNAISVVEGGTSAGTAYDGNGKGGGTSTENDHGIGDRKGKNKEDENGKKVYARKGKKRETVTELSYRIIEDNYKLGKYKLVIKPNRKLNHVELHVTFIGDNGIAYDITLVQSSINHMPVEHDGANIYIDSLQKGKWQTINLTITEKSRLKLEVQVNADK
ncbi:hypothetical protein [Ligilactobacillus hayakitensis]|uniref:hypothetical protein n=1 Tax=Ligilactobacillus hayakitensis TaxID=396716 RepID=UPI0004691546|nr:hypothetical protein [Ligilactobacillus hayakitensis]